MEGTTDAPVNVPPSDQQQTEAITNPSTDVVMEPINPPSEVPNPPVAQQEPIQSAPVEIQPPLPTNPPSSSAQEEPIAPPPPAPAEQPPTEPPPQQQQQQQSTAEEEQQPSAPSPPLPKARRGGGGRGGLITLKLLIDEGFIKPGEDVLSVEYKGMSHTGTLLADGRIFTVINGKSLTFDSPSAFSIYLKRLVNPSRKADDGWKTVKYEGKLLEHFKGELARQKFGGLGSGEGGSSADLEALDQPRTKRLRTSSSLPFSSSSTAVGNDEPFVPDRPRRVRRAPPRFAAIGVDDEHALQLLESYGPGEQPFTVQVSPAAVAMMDYHAHLCVNEVIGMLVGTVDLEEKKIKIFRAMPVKELSTEDDSINVEMDPEDQVTCMEDASKQNYKVVGWYHSHPTFPPQPSTIDIYNQVLQQHAHRVEAADGSTTMIEPYVAAIVSPYDHRVAGTASLMKWFYVDHVVGRVPTEGQRPDELGCIAKELEVVQLWEPLGQLENLSTFQREMEQIAKRYAPLPERAHLEGKWVDNSLRLEKMVASVQSRLPMELLGEQKVKQFANKLWVSTRAVWNVYGKGVAPPAVAPEVTAAVNSSVPQSAAVSQGGGGVGGEEREQNGNGAAVVSGGGGDVEEPISDCDDDAVTE